MVAAYLFERELELADSRTSTMRRILISVFMMWLAGVVAAEVPSLKIPLGRMVESISCTSDPAQTYTLYLPSTYAAGQRLPVLLVIDPRGRSLLAAELFRDAAESYGWIIVSSDNTRSDGRWEPHVEALQALWPEIHTRIPADFDRIYATGFSGGVAVATLLARSTERVAGIIACGGLDIGNRLEDARVPFFLTAGDSDFNFSQMHRLDNFLAESGNPHRLVIFEGPHTWMPREVAREAVEWMELIAMQRGMRERDPALVDRLYAKDLARAETLAADGQALSAARRLREIERTYAGLREFSKATEAADRIESGDQFRGQRKQLRRAMAYETKCVERGNSELSMLRDSDVPPPTHQLAGRLHIRDLTRNAEKTGEEGLAAQRCLNSLYSALAFYVPMRDLPEERYAQVAVSYELANRIRDDNPVVWYNLACVRALLGRQDDAVTALEKALEHGFDDSEMLATDTDLDSLRNREDFKALMDETPEY
jgi:predicted esterase